MSLLHISSYKSSPRISVFVGPELDGVKSVKLLRYRIDGIPINSTSLCYYMKIQDLDTQMIWAGLEYQNLPQTPAPNTNLKYIDPLNQVTTATSYWPLYLQSGTTSTFYELRVPVEMCAEQGWGANRRILIEFFDHNFEPAVFSSIAMDFLVSKNRDDNYPSYMRYNTPNITPSNKLYQSIMQ